MDEHLDLDCKNIDGMCLCLNPNCRGEMTPVGHFGVNSREPNYRQIMQCSICRKTCIGEYGSPQPIYKPPEEIEPLKQPNQIRTALPSSSKVASDNLLKSSHRRRPPFKGYMVTRVDEKRFVVLFDGKVISKKPAETLGRALEVVEKAIGQNEMPKDGGEITIPSY